MRRLLLPTVAAGLLALVACSPAAPVSQPASTPATPSSTPSMRGTPTAAESPTATATATATGTPTGKDKRVEEQGDGDSGDSMTSFARAHTYRDGVRVRVARIRHGAVTAGDVRAGARQKKGTPWVQLTVRVENGSKRRMTELVGDYELSYGPDKDPADPISVPGVRGHGLPDSIGRGRTGTTAWTFSVPVEDQDDVVLGFTPDIDHDTAYFSGSIA